VWKVREEHQENRLAAEAQPNHDLSDIRVSVFKIGDMYLYFGREFVVGVSYCDRAAA